MCAESANVEATVDNLRAKDGSPTEARQKGQRMSTGLPAVARSQAGEAHLPASRYGGHPPPVFMSEGWWALVDSNH